MLSEPECTRQLLVANPAVGRVQIDVLWLDQHLLKRIDVDLVLPRFFICPTSAARLGRSFVPRSSVS